MESHQRRTLGLIIPTKNRPESIRYYLEKRWQGFLHLDIDIIIYDSSDNSQTELISEEFRRLGGENIHYARYEPAGNIHAIDHKVYCASRLFCDKYDYLWFSSDGTVMNIEEIAASLFSLMDQDYDWIILDNLACPSCETKVYYDSRNLLQECGWFMTMLGTNIISKRLVKRAVEEQPVSPEKDYWLWLPFAYFNMLAEEEICAIHYAGTTSYHINKARQDSFWKLEGNVLWQWAFVWPEAVRLLPPCYDYVKHDVMRSHDKHTGLFSLKSLISMEEYDCITFKKVLQYRHNLSLVTKTSVGWFYLISLFGSKRVIKCAKTIYHRIK